MFIIDFSQVAVSNLMAEIANQKTSDISLNDLRRKVVGAVVKIGGIYSKKYGQGVIAIDDRKSWRKQVFPYYKSARKATRDKSTINWATIFGHLAVIENEIRDNFGYPVIAVDNAEGDDIIGVVVRHWLRENDESIMIVSGDKDFKQLQIDPRVSQFSPVLKKPIVSPNPIADLLEHIIRGDRDDGIPNVLSGDNVFVDPEARQRKITAGRFANLMSTNFETTEDQTLRRNFIRNKLLIDLTSTPKTLEAKIIDQLVDQLANKKSNEYNYLCDHGMVAAMADWSSH